MQRRVCSRAGCGERVVGRRLCRKHYQQAWKAGKFKNAPLPPRERARVVCPSDHQHGAAKTCYVLHQCRCDACRDNNRDKEKARRKAQAYGRYDVGLVAAAPVRAHMMVLAEYGIGYKQAAKVAGIGTTAARTLIWGRQDPGPRNGELQKRVKRETAEKLLAVEPVVENMAAGAVVPSTGSIRRVQALVTNGWSLSKIGLRIGVSPANMSKLLQQPTVTAGRHMAIAAAYEELWNALPPREAWRDRIAFSRSKNFAKVRRWLPPLAWDDIDTDVEPPLAEAEEGAVDEMAIELACMGEKLRLTGLERREVVRRLNAAHLSDPAIAERAHFEVRTVLRIRQELGIPAAVGSDKQVVA